MAKYKVGDVFKIKGHKELHIITIPKDKEDGTYGFEELRNRAIHGDVDENLIIKVRKKALGR